MATVPGLPVPLHLDRPGPARRGVIPWASGDIRAPPAGHAGALGASGRSFLLRAAHASGPRHRPGASKKSVGRVTFVLDRPGVRPSARTPRRPNPCCPTPSGIGSGRCPDSLRRRIGPIARGGSASDHRPPRNARLARISSRRPGRHYGPGRRGAPLRHSSRVGGSGRSSPKRQANGPSAYRASARPRRYRGTHSRPPLARDCLGRLGPCRCSRWRRHSRPRRRWVAPNSPLFEGFASRSRSGRHLPKPLGRVGNRPRRPPRSAYVFLARVTVSPADGLPTGSRRRGMILDSRDIRSQ